MASENAFLPGYAVIFDDIAEQVAPAWTPLSHRRTIGLCSADFCQRCIFAFFRGVPDADFYTNARWALETPRSWQTVHRGSRVVFPGPSVLLNALAVLDRAEYDFSIASEYLTTNEEVEGLRFMSEKLDVPSGPASRLVWDRDANPLMSGRMPPELLCPVVARFLIRAMERAGNSSGVNEKEKY